MTAESDTQEILLLGGTDENRTKVIGKVTLYKIQPGVHESRPMLTGRDLIHLDGNTKQEVSPDYELIIGDGSKIKRIIVWAGTIAAEFALLVGDTWDEYRIGKNLEKIVKANARIFRFNDSVGPRGVNFWPGME